MDPVTLSHVFRRTLDPSTRADAERELASMQKIIGFAPALLQVVMASGETAQAIDLPTRQATVIYFKNLVSSQIDANFKAMFL